MKSAPDRDQAVLVIGYGNELRGDDAAGPRVATAVESLGLEDVRVLVRHQLAPEISEDIARSRAVIFVDASVDPARAGVTITPLSPSPSSTPQAHVSDPRSLMNLAQTLFGRCPPAWLVTVPARNLGFGAEFSPETLEDVQAAVRQIEKLIHSLR